MAAIHAWGDLFITAIHCHSLAAPFIAIHAAAIHAIHAIHGLMHWCVIAPMRHNNITMLQYPQTRYSVSTV